MMKTAADHRPVVWRETGRPRWSRAVAGCGRRGSAAASMMSGPTPSQFLLPGLPGSCSCTVSDFAAARPSQLANNPIETGPMDQEFRMLRARVENPIRFPSPEPNSNPQSHRHRIGTIPLPAPIGFGGTVACIVYAPAARLAPEIHQFFCRSREVEAKV